MHNLDSNCLACSEHNQLLCICIRICEMRTIWRCSIALSFVFWLNGVNYLLTLLTKQFHSVRQCLCFTCKYCFVSSLALFSFFSVYRIQLAYYMVYTLFCIFWPLSSIDNTNQNRIRLTCIQLSLSLLVSVYSHTDCTHCVYRAKLQHPLVLPCMFDISF